MSIEAGNLTRPLVEPDEKSGRFEPDPSNQFIVRYVPTDKELKRINEYFAAEFERAWEDDQPVRNKLLDLLSAYRAEAQDSKQPIVTPLIKRAVKQNVAWITTTILRHKPIVTVTPDSNKSIPVLLNDPQYGPTQLIKTSEESAQAIEWWLEYKLRKKVPFAKIVKIAAKEAKRGQTPTFIKIARNDDMRTMRAPQFQPIPGKPQALTFVGKKDVEVPDGEATVWSNVSRYATLMPSDEQNHQSSRWFAEYLPDSPDTMRAGLYNGRDFLIPKREWESFISSGTEQELPPDEQRKGQMERRIVSLPPGFHETWLMWFFWPVKMVTKVPLADEETGEPQVDDETGEPKTKSVTTYERFSFVGKYHRKHRRLMSMIRNPNDHGLRPYIAIYDDQEPFRNADESLAEDAWSYQKVVTSLDNLEIRGGVIATTPVTYYQPGSIAGDWLSEAGDVQPGDLIPRYKEDEVKSELLADRPVSLIGLIQHKQNDYERQFQIGGLQLGQNLPGRTPASTLAQVLNQGEVQASMFLDSFREDLGAAVKMYVQTEQQYMRFGEVIPFDEETAATVKAALGQDMLEAGDGVAVRFPVEPIHDQFAFNITASSDDRSQQGDVERLIGLKNIVDEDANINAQLIGPLASGKLPPEIVEILVDDFTRRQKLMKDIAKAMRKDGGDFALDPKKLTAMAEKQALAAQQAAMMPPQQEQPAPRVSISLSGKLTPQQESIAAQTQGLGVSIGPQGTGIGGSDGAVSPVGAGSGAVGGMVPPPGDQSGALGHSQAIPHGGNGQPG